MKYDKKNYRSQCWCHHLDTEVWKIIQAVAYGALLYEYEKFARLVDLSDEAMAPVMKHLGLDEQPIVDAFPNTNMNSNSRDTTD
tara:strand:+ start:177 stop:428 length:252 start_codon:yes stop_codon:yes gene_type:complete